MDGNEMGGNDAGTKVFRSKNTAGKSLQHVHEGQKPQSNREDDVEYHVYE